MIIEKFLHIRRLEFIGNEFISLIKEFHYSTCILGVATGGIAIGAIVAEELGLPFVMYVLNQNLTV